MYREQVIQLEDKFACIREEESVGKELFKVIHSRGGGGRGRGEGGGGREGGREGGRKGGREEGRKRVSATSHLR